jgi:hypothetical protein
MAKLSYVSLFNVPGNNEALIKKNPDTQHVSKMEILYIKISLALLFTLSVIGKFTGKTKSTFEKAGYGKDIMYATGIAELVLSILLFTRLEWLATIGLLAIIGGALFTLLKQKAQPAKFSLAIIAAILLVILLYSSPDKYRRPQVISQSRLDTITSLGFVA